MTKKESKMIIEKGNVHLKGLTLFSLYFIRMLVLRGCFFSPFSKFHNSAAPVPRGPSLRVEAQYPQTLFKFCF